MSGVEFVPHDVAPPPTEPSPAPPPEEHLDERDAPARRRRGLGPRSLTAQLVMFVVGLIVLLTAATGVGTFYLLRPYLLDRLDQQAELVASQNAGYFDRCLSNAIPVNNTVSCFPYGHSAPVSQYEWVAFIAPGDQPIELNEPTEKGPTYEPLTLPASLVEEIRTHPGGGWKTNYEGKELVLRAGVTRDGIVVVSGLSTAEVDKTMHTLVRRELLVGAAAVLLALLATSYGVRFSLRRLRRVTATAHEVAAELSPSGAGLDRRVDVPDDGTEVGQLAGSMNTLLSAVETQFAARLESEQRLRQFLADASHELRTPLTSIRGYAELARMQRAAGADADDNLSRIESEGTRMSRLVEDLLTLARGDQSSAEPARELIDVGELVDDAARDTRAAFPDRAVESQPASNLHVIGDHDQLLRAVRNLMANAAVHTAKGRPILVRSANDGDSVIIQVIDGGPGLPPDEAAHVFERFWRADKARTRARGGSGLGLSIVSSIVAAHGGTVRFDSAVATGSTVTIRLPAVAY